MNPPTWGDRWRDLFGRSDDEPRHSTETEAPPMTEIVDTDGPFEPPDGQETDPPDLELAILVAVRVLRDVRERLERDVRDDYKGHDAAELLLRVVSIAAVLKRIRKRLGEEST